ncbi:MAG: DUF481 domain-containing protein [Lentisphaeraceae bacterium]|nr:DUF481 domain-containing protein [Lentisphaeraceae bacterium]
MKYILALFLISSSLFADDLKMKDGSLLKGKITKIHKGTIFLTTTYAGAIKVKQSEVDSYSTEQEVNVKTTKKEVIQTVVTHDGNENILTLWSDGNDPDIFQDKWVKKAWLDFRQTTGNADQKDIKVGFDLTWIYELSSFKIYGSWASAENNGDKTEDEIITGVDYEKRFKDSKGSWYARAEFERDKINDIKLAQNYAVGYGHYFIDEASTTLRGRVGLQYRMFEYYEDDNLDSIGLDFGLNFKTDITEKVKWFTDITYTPSFEDPAADYNIRHTSGLSMPLDTAWNMFLKAGVEHDYISLPSEGKEHLDTEYFLRLEVEF